MGESRVKVNLTSHKSAAPTSAQVGTLLWVAPAKVKLLLMKNRKIL